MTTIDLIAVCRARGVRLEADAERGVICWEGDATPSLLATLKAHKRQLLAVLYRLQRMIAHDESHDRPPVPMVYWPHHAEPGACVSCGNTLDHPRATGRCDFCGVAAELFHSFKSKRTPQLS